MNSNTLLTAARISGRLAGTTCRHLLWLNAQIDWAEVGQIVLHGLQVLIVMTLLAGRGTRRLWDQLPVISERLGKAYAGWLVGTPEPVAAAARTMPVMHPLMALAEQLEALTVRELQVATGCRRKLAKRQLIALALAH